MDPATLQLILYAEQMAALLAKTIVDLKNVIGGGKSAEAALADADVNYQSIISARQAGKQ